MSLPGVPSCDTAKNGDFINGCCLDSPPPLPRSLVYGNTAPSIHDGQKYDLPTKPQTHLPWPDSQSPGAGTRVTSLVIPSPLASLVGHHRHQPAVPLASCWPGPRSWFDDLRSKQIPPKVPMPSFCHSESEPGIMRTEMAGSLPRNYSHSSLAVGQPRSRLIIFCQVHFLQGHFRAPVVCGREEHRSSQCPAPHGGPPAVRVVEGASRDIIRSP
ncbi:hypothetical protein B0I37DRAFT_106857 [Chaetomium sp. MPI-CAGE-AT-0009]|nr:hypothetical protein B0I37DRAFT_106857 [Chaetomium sp. MPI-CAGE-AT-0009]